MQFNFFYYFLLCLFVQFLIELSDGTVLQWQLLFALSRERSGWLNAQVSLPARNRFDSVQFKWLQLDHSLGHTASFNWATGGDGPLRHWLWTYRFVNSQSGLITIVFSSLTVTFSKLGLFYCFFMFGLCTRLVQCTAYNSISSSSDQLSSKYFEVKPSDVYVIEGENAELKCQISSNTDAGPVQWAKDGFLLGEWCFVFVKLIAGEITVLLSQPHLPDHVDNQLCDANKMNMQLIAHHGLPMYSEQHTIN